MKGKYYNEVVLTNGETMPREQSFEDCPKCGSKKNENHQSYCEREICPLCGKYFIECNHLEGYALEGEAVVEDYTEEKSA